MNKYFSFIITLVAILGMSGADAATRVYTRSSSSANLPSARKTVNYSKTTQKTSSKKYTTSSANRGYAINGNRTTMYQTGKSQTRKNSTVVGRQVRKYFLANPFYQPLKGKFGMFTDLSYADASFDFPIIPDPVYAGDLSGITGTWNTTQFTVKEDLSFGITDRLALMAMAQFDASDIKFEWSNGSPDDKADSSELSVYGLGLQGRFVDTEEWIAMASAYYQHYKDFSDNVILELKAGYKVGTSTIYGVGRGWYLSLDGDSYGVGLEGKDAGGNPMTIYIPYQSGTSNLFYIEGGLGVFSVLNKDWTLHLESVFGNYEWHNQASIKGAFGWQPNDWFALNLYLKTVFYDSAKDKNLDLYMINTATATKPLVGQADVEKYNETRAGVQIMFEF
jgi:hypothetical protein